MYKCKKSFTSHNGKHYSSGQIIDRYAYLNLSYSEKQNFVIDFQDEDDDEDEYGGEG